ncbi:MAG: tRNA (Guanine-N1)-methyltransferase [Candidatus Curtissbacteria bacterium GW2011_GWA1_40_9]|uniref:tRNA (guanine-N(1)-)-methyltransferase n=1 Tax=Candidatus Curtissbacteria bacterium GW2011_GWA1_40_9 TaxID=1618408 RepID=A0A0G0TMT1_9BACT|nr:MAG: tRNA (Guanine-N1)-methyltransferase [Candidatus Curtissbacteria bacterium GW2011_GWA1_40_9]
MTVHILTLFPEVFEGVFSKSILKRALDKRILTINLVNIREYAKGRHKQVDDKTYGGGKGMVMMLEPIVSALNTIQPKPYTILLTASGQKFTQKKSKLYSKKKNLAIICGHYEGIDARVENFTDEVVSVGDFISTGGEIPAMLIIDSTVRLLPGVINPHSPLDESFERGLLEYPQYTRPRLYKGLKVPHVLLSGNHKEINNWRKKESFKRTKKYRPELLLKSKAS